jgi:hypothetical protein
MDPRGAVRRLLELRDDRDPELFDEELDDAAIELITALCSHLSLAVAVAQGKSARRDEARQRAAEYLAGIETVLEVLAAAEVEVAGGPHFCDAALGCLLVD